MTLRTVSYLRKIAEDALRDAGITEPPVPVDELASHYGIPVRTYRFPGFFSGALVFEDGLPVIMVNANKDDAATRLAVAHMLGHVLFVLDDPQCGFPRNDASHHPEANAIAEELITPEFMVRDQAAKWFNDYRYLARLFGVTEAEMMRKMLDLGIIKQRGIAWDY